MADAQETWFDRVWGKLDLSPEEAEAFMREIHGPRPEPVVWDPLGGNPASPTGYRAHLGSGTEVTVRPAAEHEAKAAGVREGWRAEVRIGTVEVLPVVATLAEAQAAGLGRMQAKALAIAEACRG